MLSVMIWPSLNTMLLCVPILCGVPAMAWKSAKFEVLVGTSEGSHGVKNVVVEIGDITDISEEKHFAPHLRTFDEGVLGFIRSAQRRAQNLEPSV